jgi:hypothetical protein
MAESNGHGNGNGNGRGPRWWNDRAALARQAIAFGCMLVIVGAGFNDLKRDVQDNASALKDHSRVMDAMKEKQSRDNGATKTDIIRMQIQLADGTAASQVRTDARLDSAERYIHEQRSTNATVTEQNRQTKESIQDIQGDVKGLRNEIGTLNGNVRTILNHLERRSPTPDFR